MALIDYDLLELIPEGSVTESKEISMADKILSIEAPVGSRGRIVWRNSSVQFELLSNDGDIIIRHLEEGVIGMYKGHNLIVSEKFSREGYGTAMVLHAYDNGKKPSSSPQFTIRGAETIRKAMKVARGEAVSPYWP